MSTFVLIHLNKSLMYISLYLCTLWSKCCFSINYAVQVDNSTVYTTGVKDTWTWIRISLIKPDM